MITIETHENLPVPISAELLEHAASVTLRQNDAPAHAELTIVLTDDAQLHELNRTYLGVDAPTDVLSFPSGDETDPETGALYLGDLLISVERAVAQAQAAGHAPEPECQLLVVHGVLHLLGHDHAEPEEKAAMWQAQAKAMAELGLAHISIRED